MVRKWMFILLLIVLGIGSLIGYDGYRIQQTLIGQSDRSRLLPAEKKKDDTADQAWMKQQDTEQLQLTTTDEVRIGRYLPAASSSDKTVVLLADDVRFGSSQTAPLIRFYQEQLGYNVFVPDRRGQGASEGTVNYGWLDRLDLIDWTNQLMEETGTRHVVYHGVGIGGATVLLAAGEPTVPKQVKAVISEGAYARLDDWFQSLAKVNLPYPAGPSLAVASSFNKVEQDFFYGDVSVTRQTSRIMVPTLFIQGMEDKVVPPRMVYELYQAKPGIKQLYPVRGAGHGSIYSDNPENYKKRLRLFVQPFVRTP